MRVESLVILFWSSDSLITFDHAFVSMNLVVGLISSPSPRWSSQSEGLGPASTGPTGGRVLGFFSQDVFFEVGWKVDDLAIYFC